MTGSKRCTLIELSTLGLGTTTAGPPMPDGPPMVDADPSVRVGLGQTLRPTMGRNSQAVFYAVRAIMIWLGDAVRVWRILHPCFLAVETTDLRRAKI